MTSIVKLISIFVEEQHVHVIVLSSLMQQNYIMQNSVYVFSSIILLPQQLLLTILHHIPIFNFNILTN